MCIELLGVVKNTQKKKLKYVYLPESFSSYSIVSSAQEIQKNII